ncbi:hypothetical protein ACLOJK_038503 [Asimina triloba]
MGRKGELLFHQRSRETEVAREGEDDDHVGIENRRAEAPRERLQDPLQSPTTSFPPPSPPLARSKASFLINSEDAAFWRNRSGSAEVISNNHFHINNNSFTSIHGSCDPGRLLLMWGRGFHDTGDGIGVSEIRRSSRIEY